MAKKMVKKVSKKVLKKPKAKKKIEKVLKEAKEGKLHSGSKSGPIVTDKKQAIAIGINEAKKAVKKKKKK